MSLGPEGWFTLLCLGTMFVLLVKEVFGPDLTVGGTVVVLWLSGVIDETEATRGFASAQVLTVALLFVVAAALRDSGALRLVTGRLLGGASTPTRALARLMAPTVALSAFMNNTPLVAMLTPAVRSWAARKGVSPSKLLMPISFAAILGGTCTLIGTSTNLLVSGLMEAAGIAEPLGMFETAMVALPAAVVGTIYLLTVGTKLLPDRRAPDQELDDNREFSVRLTVQKGCPFIGKEVEDAGLRHLEGLFLVEIVRGELSLLPVRPTDRIEAGDELVFVGVSSTVADLLALPGLAPTDDGDDHPAQPAPGTTRTLHEIVIPERSPLIGLNLREARFRRRYDAAVVAVHRGGHRLLQKLGDVTLRGGDTLLVEASRGFRATFNTSPDFLILGMPTALGDTRLAFRSTVVMVGMVALMASGLVSPLAASAAAVLLLLVTGCIRLGRARTAVDLSVVILLASSFGLAAAVQNSGVATLLAGAMGHLGGFGPIVALAGIYLLTAVLTEALSNAAAAALVFPVALATAAETGADPRPFCIAVAIAASMSFATPIGYQTNLLVYGPGGYKFTDFTRVGLPLAILVFVVSMVCIPWFWTL
jgi:di/tricarboxylate transporter